MDSFILFFNEFCSYILLMAIIAAVAGCGIFFGKTLRSRKDAKTAAEGNKKEIS